MPPILCFIHIIVIWIACKCYCEKEYLSSLLDAGSQDVVVVPYLRDLFCPNLLVYWSNIALWIFYVAVSIVIDPDSLPTAYLYLRPEARQPN
jgi:hypothetical protein